MNPSPAIAFRGRFTVEHIRDNKVLSTHEFPNGVTNVGKNHALDVIFNGTTQISTWFTGLISNTSYSALAAADTMSSHAGWTEATGYSESARPEWTAGSAASQAVTNASVVTFTSNATATLKGLFINSNSTKGGTTGTLWATALFAADLSVVSGDILRVTYTVTAS